MSTLKNATAARTSDEQEALRVYLRRKQNLAGKIQEAYDRAEMRKRESLARDYRDLLAKLAEDRFTLAVVGQFKRGKSSMMNAIVGKNIFPTGVLPVTAVVTILRYGGRERLLVQRLKEYAPGEVPLADLALYITHDGNPDNAKGIMHAVLEWPMPFLKSGFEFVDTPGVGSASEDSTAATYDFLRNCDAVLFVTAVEGPMNTVESKLLRAVQAGGVSTIVVILNKIDLVPLKEHGNLVEFVRREAASVLGIEPPVFPISVQAALGAPARAVADDSGGLAPLQDFLSSLVSEQRAESFLASIEKKFRAILALDGDSLAAEDEMAGGVSALASGKSDAVESHEITNNVRGIPSAGMSICSAAIAQPGPEEISRFLTERGCAVCAYLVRKAFDSFAHLQYELSVDGRSQSEFTRRSGFCPVHMWSLATYSGPDGMSRMLPPLATRVADGLRSFTRHADAAQNELGDLAMSSDACAFCNFLGRHESAFVNSLCEFLQSPSAGETYGHSYGVCLKHLVRLVGVLQSDAVVSQILRHAATRCDVLGDDMQSFALKRTALRRDRLNDDEEDAWRRFLVFMACDKRFIAPPSSR